MTEIPAPLMLLTAALAVVGVVVLWKLLAAAGLIGLTQWLVITQTESPTAVLIAIGIPALALVLLARRPGVQHRFPLSRNRSVFRMTRQEVTS
ncbi:hypothetical protein [Actinosynnema sp. NPDC023587]|uniref:hypothetical protein n=1 Tax=Actinosynnema sp. NPDC023587 TaxID=3154695 RepID=UPI0033D2C3B2